MGTNLDDTKKLFSNANVKSYSRRIFTGRFMPLPLTAFANSSETITALEHDWKNQTFANGFVSYPLVNFMRKVVS